MTGEDLGHRPSTLEKTKFWVSLLGMSFSKAFEKDKAKRYDEFEEMSLSPKYKKINDFNKRLIKF